VPRIATSSTTYGLLLIAAFLCTLSVHAQVIVTEVQPVPAAGEPEWIELVNTSTVSVALRSWQVCDPRGCVQLPDIVVRPAGMCVLTRDSIALREQRYIPDNVIVRSVALPSLNNTTDTLLLLKGASLTDSMAYDVRSSDRGRSIERGGVERGGSVLWESRWTVSTAFDSATCGRINTAVMSEQDYRLRGVHATRDRLVVVVANDGTRVGEARRVQCAIGEERVDTVLGALRPGDVVEWTLPEVVSRGRGSVRSAHVQVQLEGADDRPENDTIRTAFVVPPTSGTLMINEVLAQPRSGECDFVEVWNGTDMDVDLADWIIETARGVQYRCVPPLTIPVGGFGVLCAALSSPSMHAVQRRARTSPTLSITQERDLVVLCTPEGLRVDSMWYDREYHHPRVATHDGVSLEKRAVQMRSEQAAAWTSCAALERATPGLPNSVAQEVATQATLEAEPTVISSDRRHATATTRIAWSLPYQQARARIDVRDETGAIRQTLCNSWFIAAQGSVAWDGCDADGLRVEPGPYVVSMLAVDADTADVARGVCLVVVAE